MSLVKVSELSTTGRFSTGIRAAQRVRANVPSVMRHGSPIRSCTSSTPCKQWKWTRPRCGVGRARPARVRCGPGRRPRTRSWVRLRTRTRATTVGAWACRRGRGGFAASRGRTHGRCVRGRVARPVVGLAPPPVPQPTPAEENARAVPTAPIAPGRWERLVPAVRERLPMWLQLRCGLEPRTLAALAVVLVAAAVFAAVHFWSARPQSVRAPDPVSEGAQAPASDPRMDRGVERARTPDPSPGPPPTGGPGGRIVVDVSGKVRRPGIYPLPSGARVADALRAAGGVRSGVDLTGLNRARVLMDGEQVVVGAPPGSQAFGATGGAAAGGAAAGAAWRPHDRSGQPQQRDGGTAGHPARCRPRSRPAHRRLPHAARRLPVRR